MTKWQPIETAPKGKTVDLWTAAGRVTDCYWGEASEPIVFGEEQDWPIKAGDVCWVYDTSEFFSLPVSDPTHWMPIPEAPFATPTHIGVDVAAPGTERCVTAIYGVTLENVDSISEAMLSAEAKAAFRANAVAGKSYTIEVNPAGMSAK